jgi:hypothetical protein
VILKTRQKFKRSESSKFLGSCFKLISLTYLVFFWTFFYLEWTLQFSTSEYQNIECIFFKWRLTLQMNFYLKKNSDHRRTGNCGRGNAPSTRQDTLEIFYDEFLVFINRPFLRFCHSLWFPKCAMTRRKWHLFRRGPINCSSLSCLRNSCRGRFSKWKVSKLHLRNFSKLGRFKIRKKSLLQKETT